MKATWRKEDATITVYLSLILMLLLSLIFTMIEGARVSTARVFAERALSTATDSVLAEYYGPLWKEYHLFGYDAGEGSFEEKAGRLEEVLSEYMSYTLSPGKDLAEDRIEGALNLMGLSLDSVEVEEQIRLMDYEGELFRNEAVEYMKYHTAADAIEILLDKLSLLEEPKKVSVVYEEKLKAEEKLAEIDRDILRLMELFDGLRTSNKGIRLDQNGKLQMNKYNIKMFYTGEITASKVSINHDAVFQAWKESYMNPANDIALMKQRLKELEELTLRQNDIDQQVLNLEMALSSAQSELSKIGNGGSSTEQNKQQGEEIAEQIAGQISGYREAISRLHEEKTALAAKKQELIQSVESNCSGLSRAIGEVLQLIQESTTVIDRITVNASVAAPLIEKFEDRLALEEDHLGTELLQELSDSLTQMKQYSAESEDMGYGAMKDILLKNQELLPKVRADFTQCISELKNENYFSCQRLLDSIMTQLSDYRVTELSLDYSTLVMEKEKPSDPVEAVSEAINHGLMTLVMDTDKISDKILSEESLPSTEAGLLMQETDFGAMLQDFISDFTIRGNTSGMQNIMNCFTDTDALLTTLGNGMNKASEHLLFQEYMKEHFKTCTSDSGAVMAGKPSALSYEQEYLLYGKLADKDNLSTLVGRLVFLRMLANFVTLLGDRIRVQEALAAATALVGFTGLPILISITKTMLLLVWSFSEALVDVCALLQGKEVPVLKKSIVLTLPEMFLLNRNYLETKVPMLEQSKLSLSYQEYLYLFLLLKNKQMLAYYAMDLIQENINLRYDDILRFSNLIYGFQVKSELSSANKFISIPLIRNYMKPSTSGYRFQFRMDACY